MEFIRRIWRNRRKRTLVIVLAALILINAAIPPAIRWYVNEELNRRVKDYHFHIGDVDVWLIRGAVEIEDVVVTKLGGKAPVPFVNADQLDISIYWKKIFNGFLVAEMIADHPVVNLVFSEKKEWVQTGAEVAWLRVVRDMTPIRIDKFEVNDGEIHLYNFDLMILGREAEPGHVYVKDGYAIARNLTNSDRISKSMVATLEGRAKAMDQADIATKMSLDPFDKIPTFDLDLEMHDLEVASLDKMMKTYTALDLERGTFSVAMEVASDNGKITGYVKPVFKDLEVFRVKKDIKEDKDTGLEAIWESVAGTIGAIFKNQPKDQVATRIELSGNIEEPKTDILGAIAGILQNAFVRAFLPELENSVRLEK